MENEQWLPWSVNSKYEISNMGRIKSFRSSEEGEIISIQHRKDGYCKVSLIDDSKEIYADGRTVNPYLHRLIAEAFIPNPDNLPEVNHKDRDKSNCAASNLEWCTHKYNIQHSYDNGRSNPSGADHWNYGRKYTTEQRKAMAEAKTGEKHPKFKGWYCKAGKQYASAQLAQDATGENKRTITRQSEANTNGWAFLRKPNDTSAYKDHSGSINSGTIFEIVG